MRATRGEQIHVAFVWIFIVGAIGLGSVLLAFPAPGGTPRLGGFFLVAMGASLLLVFRKDLLGARKQASDGSPP